MADSQGLHWPTGATHYPQYFEIETARACNADCSTCTKRDWRELGPPVMDPALFSKIVQDMQPHADQIKRVCLSRNGEPLLDPHIIGRIKLLKDIGIREVSFSTNGQLLDGLCSEKLLDAGLDMIMLSVDGATAATFEEIRKGLSFETVTQNIIYFLKLRDSRNAALKVRLRLVETEDNRQEHDNFLNFWKAHISDGDDLYIMPMHSWGNQKYAEDDEKVATFSTIPCVSPFSTMVILVNGIVPLCGADYNATTVLGDIRHQSIQEIWTGKGYDECRRKHLGANRNAIRLCRGCDIWNREYRGIYTK